MAADFERYNLPRFRVMIGALQILGSIGLAIGFFIPWLTVFASLGLAVQMLLGVLVRVKIKDSIIEMLPAAGFCILNSFIFWMALRSLYEVN